MTAETHDRRKALDRFYELLDDLEKRLGGRRRLGECDARMGWPDRGVYFFFEGCQFREASEDLRVVRVGTHAVTAGASTTLWQRLSQHRSGNHRASSFRKLIGSALPRVPSTWDAAKNPASALHDAEARHEGAVSDVIRSMPFVYLSVLDAPGPNSKRAMIARGATALLAIHERYPPVDPATRARGSAIIARMSW